MADFKDIVAGIVVFPFPMYYSNLVFITFDVALLSVVHVIIRSNFL